VISSWQPFGTRGVSSCYVKTLLPKKKKQQAMLAIPMQLPRLPSSVAEEGVEPYYPYPSVHQPLLPTCRVGKAAKDRAQSKNFIITVT
jgi:hypothetical protein